MLDNWPKSTEPALEQLSFYQKRTALSLIITSLITLYFAVDIRSMWPSAIASGEVPDSYGRLVITTVIILIVTQMVLQTILSIGSGVVPPLTPQEKQATLKGTQVGQVIHTLVIFVAIGSLTQAELAPFFTINLLILGFVLGEIVKYVAQLLYMRDQS